MSSTRSIIAPPPFAENALTVIPPTPVAGVSYRDPTAGPASSPDGWPYAERVNSAEFNQIMFQLSSLLSFLDKKGILGWSDLVDYTEFGVALGSDGVTYKWVSNSGPANGGAQDPVTDTAHTFWDVAFIDRAALSLSSPNVASASGVSVGITTASATATFAIGSAIAGVGLDGASYRLTSMSKSVNLAATGAGGMDTGSAPVSGYVATYLIYNPDLPISPTNPTVVARDVTAVVAGEVYGGVNMPSGYTASALISILATNASGQFKIASQKGRKVSFEPVNVLTSVLNQPTFVSLSIAGAVPLNAKHASGTLLGSSSSSTPISMQVASTAGSMDAQQTSASSVLSVGTPFRDIDLLTPQTIFRVNTVGSGTPSFSINVTNFTF